jgi:hypothetical protein
MLSILETTPPRTAPEVSNHSWPQYRGAGAVMVFVHGVLSSSRSCWFNRRHGTFWPNLIADDPGFNNFSLFLGGYYTGLEQGELGIADHAEELLRALAVEIGGNPAVLDHGTIVFVCHSLGGAVVRYLIECWRESFKDKTIGLVLIASPAHGSGYANSIDSLIRLYQHEAGRQLQYRSPELRDLDKRFRRLLNEHLMPRLRGVEFYEQFFFGPKWLRWLPPRWRFAPVVPRNSMGLYFGEPRLIAGSDHSSCVKPARATDDVHRYLREFCTALLKEFPPAAQGPRARAAPSGAPAGVEPQFRCGIMALEIDITEDGDGFNTFSLEEIIDARDETGAPAYPMHPTILESGHTSPYFIARAHTSPGTSIKAVETSTLLVHAGVVFDHHPSEAQPLGARLESIDFQAYAMDAAELRSAVLGRATNVDYVQKSIRWERVRTLVLAVRFPKAMRLNPANPPYAEVFNLIGPGGEERFRNESLTLEAVDSFYYSAKLRSATLVIRSPRPHTAYRINWELSDPPPGAGPRIAAAEAALTKRRRDLLEIRKLFATADAGLTDAGRQRKRATLEAVAGFMGYAIELVQREMKSLAHGGLPGPNLDPARIEVTLLGVDSFSAPPRITLQPVAGTHVADPAIWNRELPLGHGIGGRAAKKVEPRVFNRITARGTPSEFSYRHFPNLPAHEWIVCLPVWREETGRAAYGVLSLGTFDEDQAQILAILEEGKFIEQLLKYANETFLPSLF